MKNITSLFRGFLFFALITFAFACKKLDEKPISTVTPENFGNSVLQIEAAYAGSMNYLWNYWEGYGYAYGPFINDDQLNNGDLDIPADNADDLWNAHYKALLNINNALRSIKNGNLGTESQDVIDG